MGVVLTDDGDADHDFSVNRWHWHAIVEVVRRTGVLPADRVDGLHEAFAAFCGRCDGFRVL